MTNCVNCGAVLHGNKCEYCGTEYNGTGITADFSEEDCTGVLSFGGKEYDVYIGHMEAQYVCGANIGRTPDGKLHIVHGQLKHKFTLIEV